jgi:uncharacterized protein
MKCFYHSADLDGHCSGAIVKLRYPDCEMIGINYGDPFPWDSLKLGEDVWLVDFCLQPFEDMIILNGACSLTWIDHHKTSIESQEQYHFLASKQQVLNMDQAACELTWKTCYPGMPFPKAVYYLGRYDIWKHADVPGALEFQYGMRFEEDTRPSDTTMLFWKDVILGPIDGGYNYTLEEIEELGHTLLEHERRQNAKYAESCAFLVHLDGLRCIAINKGLANSLLFESVYDPEQHDAMLSFVWRKGRWNFSLYATKPEVDVSAICKARGGGGHKGAAGFQANVLPWADLTAGKEVR